MHMACVKLSNWTILRILDYEKKITNENAFDVQQNWILRITTKNELVFIVGFSCGFQSNCILFPAQNTKRKTSLGFRLIFAPFLTRFITIVFLFSC